MLDQNFKEMNKIKPFKFNKSVINIYSHNTHRNLYTLLCMINKMKYSHHLKK